MTCGFTQTATNVQSLFRVVVQLPQDSGMVLGFLPRLTASAHRCSPVHDGLSETNEIGTTGPCIMIPFPPCNSKSFKKVKSE